MAFWGREGRVAKMFEHILLENDGYGKQKPKMKNTQKSCKVRLINGFKINPRFCENQSVICPSRSVILVKSGVIL